MKKLFFCFMHCSMLLSVLLLICLILLGGCTLHFKGEKLEFDADRQRVQVNKTFELASVNLL